MPRKLLNESRGEQPSEILVFVSDRCDIKYGNDLYRYLSGNIKYRPAGRSFHENRLASIIFGQKKWQKSRISQFFQRLFGNFMSVHFCSRELSQTPNRRIDNGKFFICWYHIFHLLWIIIIWQFSIFAHFLILLKDFLINRNNVKFPYRFSFVTRISYNGPKYGHNSQYSHISLFY